MNHIQKNIQQPLILSTSYADFPSAQPVAFGQPFTYLSPYMIYLRCAKCTIYNISGLMTPENGAYGHKIQTRLRSLYNAPTPPPSFIILTLIIWQLLCLGKHTNKQTYPQIRSKHPASSARPRQWITSLISSYQKKNTDLFRPDHCGNYRIPLVNFLCLLQTIASSLFTVVYCYQTASECS